MLAGLYCTKSAVDFDAYRAISTHNSLSVMFVFFIAVFWFFLDFVKVTAFFEIDDNQHITKTAMRHVVVAFRDQILSKLWHVAEHSETPHISRTQKFSFDDFDTITLSGSKKRKKDFKRRNMNDDRWLYAYMSWNLSDAQLI